MLRNLAHRQQMGLLLSTHDLDLALRFADRLWVMTSEGQLIQGYPEALALSGEFAKVFASNNLDWDAELGSFRAHPTPCLHVHMRGEGIAHNWTRRALERLGFGITSAPQQATFSVEISDSKQGSNWTISHAAQNHHFGSVRELIDWIQSKEWSR